MYPAITVTYFLKVQDSNRDNFGTLIMDISQTVIDRANITIQYSQHRKSSIGISTFDLDPSQVHAHFD